ncbi:hypothetical protein GCM10027598_84470 [Amycolatopsis oliviviridis]|uniref:Secreted protein n=1 Tax=Amycolatopsis oliviviridis TaxID=1471590 RepID=A0ABQ3L7C1_9PSEU|nr:hypothetical protein [Amycolatopsis oliviviridis]GHH07515.1 hypothetical protein GCM10017790_14370 [Amycolatopsis oliviviridis]
MIKRILSLAAALSIAAVAAGTGTAAADAAAPDRQRFMIQATTAGLNAAQAEWLQLEVERYLATMGGRQTAPNKIDIDGEAEVRIALPGEESPRELGSPPGAAKIPGPCDGGTAYGHFCAYSGTFGKGTQIDMYKCDTYRIPWASVGSWGNNQTKDTVALFLNNSGFPIDSSKAPSNNHVYDWNPVHDVINC